MPNRQKIVTIVTFSLVILFAVLARWVLFTEGILYGPTAAKAASLLVAGIIVAAGYLPLRMLRRSNKGQEASKESIAAVLAGILGLALSAYAAGELFAPDTPVAATASACDGVPVYGAPYFAETQPNGVNARSGAGIQYPQVSRYGGSCTLGFDGYCIGISIPDYLLGTPDQRWLIVHDRSQFVAAGVVLSQSAESNLGSAPSPKCKNAGGETQPERLEFSYNTMSGRLNASAPGAVAVGYGLAAVPQNSPSYHSIALATKAGFPASLSAAAIPNVVPVSGGVWLAASVCLADNVPVVSSLRVNLLTFRGTRVAKQSRNVSVPRSLRPLLAEIACNGSGL